MNSNTRDVVVFFCSSTAVALLVCYLVARKSNSFYGALITHPRRFPSLDGLRGFLALYVCTAHVSGLYYMHTCGVWDCGPLVPGLKTAAEIAVVLFFLTTGFLFWLRALEGRKKSPVLQYYWGRLFRLGPIYILYAIPVLIMVGVTSGWTLRVPRSALAQQIAMAMGVGIFKLPDINGVINPLLLNVSLWTLPWEWKFYLCFPFAALVSFCITTIAFRQAYSLLLTAAIFVSAVAFPTYNLIVYFAWGMLAAQLFSVWPNLPFMRSRWATFLQIAILILLLKTEIRLIETLDLTSPTQAILTGLPFLIFVPIAYGNSFFNLLTSPASQCLGQITYSVYVSHCILIQCLLFFLDSRGIRLPSLSRYYLYSNLVVAAIVGLSLLTFRFIEHPLMHLPFPRMSPRAPATSDLAANP